MRQPPAFAPSASLSASGTQPVAAPKISDFGLAKQLDSEDGLTRRRFIMGSPAYMAPEQAFGQSKNVGPAADIYALGAILYECLTGRPPFKGATIADTLEQVRTMEPITHQGVHQGRYRPTWRRSACTACTRTRSGATPRPTRPGRRSAPAIAREADHRAAGRQPGARHGGGCRRHPGWALMIGLVAALLVGTTVISLGAYIDVSAQRTIAENKRIEADGERKKAESGPKEGGRGRSESPSKESSWPK